MAEELDAAAYQMADRLNRLARHLAALRPHGCGWSDEGSAGRFTRQMRRALLLVAAADGTTSRSQRRILQILFPFRYLRRDMTGRLVSGSIGAKGSGQVVANILPFMQANAAADPSYVASNDPIIDALFDAGILLCACPDGGSAAQTRTLAQLVFQLQQAAADIERSQATCG